MKASDRLVRLPMWLRVVVISALFASVPTAWIAVMSRSVVRATVSFALLFFLMLVVSLATQVRAGASLTSREDHSST